MSRPVEKSPKCRLKFFIFLRFLQEDEMAKKPSGSALPSNYRQLAGSERRPASGARLLGPADPKETFKVTIMVRRRPDGPPIRDMESLAAIRGSGKRTYSPSVFAARHGASPEDIDQVSQFAKAHGLTVVESNPARRTIVVS